VPDYRRRVALLDDAFPPRFIEEREAWLRVLSGTDRLAAGDRLSRRGRRPLRKITVDFHRTRIKQLAAALVHRGHAAEAMTLRYLVKNGDAALRYFLDRLPPNETTGQVHNLAITLHQVGQYLKVGKKQMTVLRGYCRGTAPDDTGMSETKGHRRNQFHEPENLRKLLRLAGQVWKRVARNPTPTRADAVDIELAVAVELLLMKPMRIASLAGLDFGKHVSRTRLGTGGITHISVPAANVKNRVAFDVELPAPSANLLELYRTRYHPLLADGVSWVFPGEGGKSKRPDALGAQIKRFIKRETGFDVNPHLIRSIAAMIILNRNPGAYEDVRQVLGTKTLAIIVRHYCGDETRATLKRYDEMILDLRAPAADEPSPRRRSGR
jgi:hypothetical protein